MEVPVRDIVRRVSVQLYDEGNANWSEPELAEWFREGLNALATLRPDLFTRTKTVPLTEGSARQSLPDDAVRVTRVLGVRDGGEDAKLRALTRFDLRSMSAAHPEWQAATGRPRQYSTTADQKVFWLYPAPGSADYYADVEAIVVPAVPDVDTWGDEDETESPTIELDSRFQRALVDYILYRALDKDSDTANPERAQARYQAFHDAAFDSFYPPPKEAQEQMANQQQVQSGHSRN